ncbi:MAG: 4-oxalocrotonate decarboxylase [Alphaproteobacteria bacterium]|nr:4-oxalocrotonate decarboxylase [Alphaproteobacteria bacterium]
MANVVKIAETLDNAARHAEAIEQISNYDKMTLPEAYEVQRTLIRRRLDRGEKRVGMKMGFTSRAKMVQMGLSDLVWGRLTDQMVIEDGGVLAFKNYVHPRVEPEVAFLLKRPLGWPVTGAEALAAVEAVAPAMEIIDSRYKNFKFSLEDVVADNSSSSGFVVGPWQKADGDLTNLGMVLEFDGRPVQIGSSAAILGNPIRSLVAAARLTHEAEEGLQAGWIVMAGGATAAEALKPGVHVRHIVETLGFVSFTVSAG